MKTDTTDFAGAMVATPVGTLDLASYASLRDTLLKLAADEPLALIVRLGPGFTVPSRAMLSVFTTVWMKISQWPDIPLVLLAETESHRRDRGSQREVGDRALPRAVDRPHQPGERCGQSWLGCG